MSASQPVLHQEKDPVTPKVRNLCSSILKTSFERVRWVGQLRPVSPTWPPACFCRQGHWNMATPIGAHAARGSWHCSVTCACALLSRQSWLTLWPRGCSPPGSSVHGILQARRRVGCHALLQGIFPTQGPSPGLPHCRRILYHLNQQGSPQGSSANGATTTEMAGPAKPKTLLSGP